ncbi:TIM barrel protein [uncultured Corynebacterium sp.]|uniref:TIM barrel protein n=1 Tax=uncultured Corynebacterium sp. TaxID=159447 RepID=UPI0025ED7143|nr:TIM barrel protein [uncultured Corynebacterium sp.]
MTPDANLGLNHLCTVINCSVGRPPGDPDLDRATALGLDRIELWWPWTTPEPTDTQVDDLIGELDRRGLTLVALNFWGGDTSVGERGVLHREPLSRSHLDAHARLAERTGADLFNLLVGRGGRSITDAQRERTAAVASSVTGRGLGTVLVEPSRSPGAGPADYPVQTVADALDLIDDTPGTALLADLWHLAETEGHDGVRDWLDDPGTPGTSPLHVQIADDPGRGAPGSGVLPLGRWLTDLRASGYTGEVAGEWVW